MAWRIDYADAALRQLRRMDRTAARRILDFMDERIAAGDPRAQGKALSGPLGSFWRYRLGDYRVVCDIRDEVLTVLVVRVGHRKDVYR